MTTGERITKLRESRNVLQKDLAKIIGVDPVVLNRIEKGKRSVRGEELRDIAYYFNVSADYLLGNDRKREIPLSENQTTLLEGFEELNAEGKTTLLSMLNFLRTTNGVPLFGKSQVTGDNGSNYGIVGGNFNSNVTIG